MSPLAELRFGAVTIRLGGATLLGPIDMTLNSPGITVIMGPNGAGKSLFLAAAHGLPPDHSGRVTWDGTTAAQSRASRGFVFQSAPILRRSVAGNIALPLRAQGISRPERAAHIKRALDAARLATDPRKPAAALSGGERKRLDLARAIVLSPKVVMLDEPAANLDPASTAELEAVLQRLSAGGTKIILSTHDIAQARRLGADILFFDRGRLVEQTTTARFFENPKSEAAGRYLDGVL